MDFCHKLFATRGRAGAVRIVELVKDVIRVLVVDDQALIRQALANFFDGEPGFSIVGTASDGQEAVDLCLKERPDVVMMDLQMPGVDGVEGTRRIVELDDPPKVIALTTFSTLDWVVSALRAGASGYMVKDTNPDLMLASVRSALDDTIAMSPQVAQLLADQVLKEQDDVVLLGRQHDAAQLVNLSDRELEVVTLLGGGLNNKEMAEQMHLSEGSIKMHLARACDRLEARDRVQLLIRAVELGIVQPQIKVPETTKDRKYM